MWARIGRRSSSLPVLPGQRPHGAMDRVTGRFAATALIERLSPAGIVTSIVAVELVGQLAERLFQHLVPLPRLRQLGPHLPQFSERLLSQSRRCVAETTGTFSGPTFGHMSLGAFAVIALVLRQLGG